jgi:hypothetical protein
MSLLIRRNIAFIALAAVPSVCVAVSADKVVTLRSQRRSVDSHSCRPGEHPTARRAVAAAPDLFVSISLMPPDGFQGPAYQTWPNYDEFSFAHGDESSRCYLQVRFDRNTDGPADSHSAEDIVVHWNSTPLAKIREQYKREFQSPQVDPIQTMTLTGKPARVYAVYNADGNFFAAETIHGGTVISFELRSPTRRELLRHKAAFLSLLRSVRIRQS